MLMSIFVFHNSTSFQVLEGFGGVPPIRPLETLHNALSLRQLDTFLEKMTVAPLFKTPASSPPKYPSTPLATTPTQLMHTSPNVVTALVTDKLMSCGAAAAAASGCPLLSSKCTTRMMGSEHDVSVDVMMDLDPEPDDQPTDAPVDIIIDE